MKVCHPKKPLTLTLTPPPPPSLIGQDSGQGQIYPEGYGSFNQAALLPCKHNVSYISTKQAGLQAYPGWLASYK